MVSYFAMVVERQCAIQKYDRGKAAISLYVRIVISPWYVPANEMPFLTEKYERVFMLIYECLPGTCSV